MQGQVTFYGDGNGDLDATMLLVNHNATNIGTYPLSYNDVSGGFAYSIESANYFKMYQDVTSVRIAGPGGPGFTLTVNDIVQEGWIGHGGQTLVLGDTDINVENLAKADGTFLGTRSCGRSGTANKIP
jgi:hypothetical protein